MSRAAVVFAVLAAACSGEDIGDTTPQPDAETGAVELVLGFVNQGPIDPGPVEGATIDVYAEDDLTTSLGSGTTGADGRATISLIPPPDFYVVHATLSGYRDSWFWSSFTVIDDLEFLNIPIASDADWDDAEQTLQLRLDPANGLVGMRAVYAEGDRVDPMTAKSSTGGTPVYFARDDAVDVNATSSPVGIAFIANVPAGDVTITASDPTRTGTRDITSFADSLSSVIVVVP